MALGDNSNAPRRVAALSLARTALFSTTSSSCVHLRRHPRTPLTPPPYFFTASARAIPGRTRRCQQSDGGRAARAAGHRDGGGGGRGRCDMAGKSGVAFTWRTPFVAGSIHLGRILKSPHVFCFFRSVANFFDGGASTHLNFLENVESCKRRCTVVYIL